VDILLAIDIHGDCVSGALVEHGQRVTVVRGYGLASARELPLAEAVADVIRQTGFEYGDCRVAMGAENFSFRNLVLPFADARKIEKILPLELEELTSSRLDDFHLDFLTIAGREDGTEIVAAMVERNYFAEVLSQLAGEGLDPEIVTVGGVETALALLSTDDGNRSFVLLDTSLRQTTIILVENGKVALVRSLSVDAEKIGGFSLSFPDVRVSASAPEMIQAIVRQLVLQVQQTLISIGRSHLLEAGAPCFVNGEVGLYPAMFDLLQKEMTLEVRPCNIAEQPLLKIEPTGEVPWNPAIMNRALALALWKRKEGPLFNFRKGDFKKQLSLKNLRKNLLAVSLPLAVIVIGVVFFSWWEYSALAGRRDALRDEAVAVFRETLPEVTRVVNPVQQLQTKIAETRDLYRPGSTGRQNIDKLALLSELSARIPETLAIRITRLVADQNDVRITAETTNFNTVDNVKRELEKSALFRSVTITSANLAPKGGEVRFELKLEFR